MPTEPLPLPDDPPPHPEELADHVRAMMTAVGEVVARSGVVPYILLTIHPANANAVGVWMMDAEADAARVAKILQGAATAVANPSAFRDDRHIDLDPFLPEEPDGA